MQTADLPPLMDLKRRAIQSLPVLPTTDQLYQDPACQSLPSPTMVGSAYPQDAPVAYPQDAPAAAYSQGFAYEQAATPQAPPKAQPALRPGQSIQGRFTGVSTEVQSRFAWQKRWRYLGFAKEAVPWMAAAFLTTAVLLVVIRPSFVYSRSDDFTAPQFSLVRLVVLAALAALVTFGLTVYGLSATLL